ncbi:MAG: hypothetical protein ACTSRI_00410 [Promethearchaeota archaeon]
MRFFGFSAYSHNSGCVLSNLPVSELSFELYKTLCPNKLRAISFCSSPQMLTAEKVFKPTSTPIVLPRSP